MKGTGRVQLKSDLTHQKFPCVQFFCNSVFPTLYLMRFDNINPLMHNFPKWSNTHKWSNTNGICCKIFKVCLTILGHSAWKGWGEEQWIHNKEAICVSEISIFITISKKIINPPFYQHDLLIHVCPCVTVSAHVDLKCNFWPFLPCLIYNMPT